MPDLTTDGRLPLLLLPVRLETRFDAGNTALRVRVYPDDIHVDAHDPRLSADEVADGRRYHELLASGQATRAQAWVPLARRYESGRARWIVRATADGADPEQREDGDARPAEAQCLPDRWVAVARWQDRSGATRETVHPFDQPVRSPLPLTPSADDKTAMEDLWSGSGATGGVRWMLDFDRAVEAGMADRIELGEPAQVVDRLVVFGVQGSETGETDAVDLVHQLAESHAYSDGFAFVPQGTPAHHAPGARSGHDPEAAGPPPPERPVPLPDQANGVVLARALGLGRADVLREAPHAADQEQGEAGTMNAALWGPTWEYYLEQHMSPAIGASDRLPEVRRHFAGLVRGRGPLPAVRVRRQPYGMLPATSLALWTPEDDLEDALGSLLAALSPSWVGAAEDGGNEGVPHLGRLAPGHDAAAQVAEIIRVLGMGPHPETVGGRPAAPLPGVPSLRRAVEATLASVGVPSADAGLLNLAYPGGAPFPIVPDLPLVAYPPGSAGHGRYPLVPGASTFDALIEEALPSVIRDALRGLQPEDHRQQVQAQLLPGQFGRSFRRQGLQALEEGIAGGGKGLSWFAEAPYPLLYALLWRGAFLQYVRVAADGLRQSGADIPVPYRESVRAGLTPTVLVDRFVTEVLVPELGVSEEEARQSLSRDLPFLGRVQLSEETVEAFRSFWEAVDALGKIGMRPGGVEALELLLRETLSVASHRLDAWVTSLAAKRLGALREAKPDGLWVGGYGWVEDIIPGGAPAADGYVHAPSVGQATTAAVLRSGYLSHQDAAPPDQSPFAVDLSSSRVRAALGLLEGVRAGLSLGELLGYRLERALHEGHPGLELDALRLRLRQAFPLVAGKRTGPGGDGAADVVGPANVVDGLAVLRASKGQGAVSLSDILDGLSDSVLPGQWSSARQAIEAEVAALDDAVDAVSDLAVAEGVHQLVMGNPTRAGAALDALGRGEAPPPEFDVVRTPRSGQALTHRVVVVDGRPAAAPLAGRTPRARAEPTVNAWAADLLGDLGRVRCVIRTGHAGGEAPSQTHEVRLGALGLDPIDLLALGGEGTAQQTELDLRVAAHVLTGVTSPDSATVEIDYNPPPGPPGAVAAAATLQATAALRRLLADARPLHASDLVLPEDRPEGDGSSLGRDDAELAARAEAARCTFASAFEALRHATALPAAAPDAPLLDPAAFRAFLSACGAGPAVPGSLADAVEGADLDGLAAGLPLDLGAIRDALFGLALFGVQGAAPQTVAGDGLDARAALLTQAASVGRELHARAAALADGSAPDPLAQFEVIFGRGFLVVPRFAPADGPSAFAASDRLQDDDPFAAVEWAHRVAPARPRTGALVDALVDAEALSGEPRLALSVGQLPDSLRPDGTDRAWAALPDGARDGRLSVVAWVPGGDPAAAASLAGLLVDEWTETVPDAEEATALAFPYDAPGARPPQALLLAVSPDPSKPWTTDSLWRVLDETLDLAKARAVDLDGVRAVGHALPALHL